MGLTLSNDDRGHITALLNNGVLQKVQGDSFPTPAGVILVTCGDGDHFQNIYWLFRTQLICPGERERIHVLSRNGGALLLAPQAPRRVEGLLREIEEACTLKGIEATALCSHAPCGVARSYSLTVARSIDLLIQGKRFARSYMEARKPTMRFACFLHVHHGGDEKEIYFISASHWDAVRAQFL